jgi:hypothetical protein
VLAAVGVRGGYISRGSLGVRWRALLRQAGWAQGEGSKPSRWLPVSAAFRGRPKWTGPRNARPCVSLFATTRC